MTVTDGADQSDEAQETSHWVHVVHLRLHEAQRQEIPNRPGCNLARYIISV